MLILDRLSKTYADGTRALADISLSLRAGEIVALIGGSGCGKTTLLRLIAGLDRASAGTVSLDGEGITAPHPGVGIVFQEPRLLPWLSVADNVAFGLAGLPKAERRARVAHALDRVGLAEQAGRWPRDLSGGQQQRVAIARAFVAAPKVLLLDEPFSALDALTRAGLHRHLLSLWEESRPTVLLVTHDVAEAVALADRAVVLRPKPGRIDDTIPLPLSRPRQASTPNSEAAARTILASLDRSMRPEGEADRARPDAPALWW
ncbi:sulfonate transport system ATP-binding protein [Methylobacterium sp. 174MFSha1.1]|uniref:ABC transporter ATP-binding protein n=1 Tax=Methylobacterium sp. 174MFSha1.1 TaxID=1502749 RepID=UPI0008E36AEC|nr:ABC transporter ATP-binding protein [Methylobacterium sp. 174MFSha1.1]SFU78556.1 sulfonate transport system ATP-binding protein [Methylobacterium sp. 174MFSha1.1]